jgi:16S rRNA processing protein RimM
MIKKDEVFRIGLFHKPHGVKGELSFSFTDDIFDRVDCPYLICLMDGILVPFFIEEYRFRTDTTALVKLEDVDTAERARQFTNVEVYFPKKYVEEETDDPLPDEIPSWDYFEGFRVVDVHHGSLGEIVSVDESTMNVLFVIEHDGHEVLLPAHEEFILKLDRKQRVLTVEVPEGLLE